ncbi:MAG: serine protease [Opitutus sp.]|nr:serine protease [Opitutus sp.]
MSVVILFFAAGVLLLAAEVVVPGAILGILGGISMLAGVVAAFGRFGVNGGAVATGAAIGLVGTSLYLEFVLLPKSRLAKIFSITTTGAEKSQPAIASRAVIGSQAVAITPLTPTGVVELEGRRYEAFARSGQVAAGALIEIVDLDNFRLIVTKHSTNQTT